MNENEIKIAERFNILDKCQKLEKDFLRLSRITKVEFDLKIYRTFQKCLWS